MPNPVLRDRLTSYLPFIAVAAVGQLSEAWPPGPVDRGAFVVSSVLLVLLLVQLLARRGMPPRTFVVGAALYMSSVAFLMLAGGGIGSGLGVLLFMPVVGIALYGKPWESVVGVGFVLLAILAVAWADSPALLGTVPRRLLLTGAVAAVLAVAIHVLRGRLTDSNARMVRLLHQEEALNAAARQLVQLSEPPQITALGAQLAMGIASPPGSEILRSSYFRIEDGMVVIDAQYDTLGTTIQATWPLRQHPGLREAVATLEPVSAPLDYDAAGPERPGGARRIRGHPRRLGPGLPGREVARRARHRQPGRLHPERMCRPVRRPRARPRTRALQLCRASHARAAGDGGGAPPHRSRAA